jgi:hypothetical protein
LPNEITTGLALPGYCRAKAATTGPSPSSPTSCPSPAPAGQATPVEVLGGPFSDVIAVTIVGIAGTDLTVEPPSIHCTSPA